MRILCIGPLWRGSNAGGLFKAISRQGCIIDIVDEFYYLSFHSSGIVTKVIQKCIRGLQAKEFNNAIQSSIEVFRPDILFVYKGTFVFPSTLDFGKRKGCKLALFYPDVSMTSHSKYLRANIPSYDIVFTTKTFGIKDLQYAFNVNCAHFIPHGFDPDIHRRLDISEKDKKFFACDVSFIGTYSPKKEKYLSFLKQQCPNVDLKIWGEQWYKATAPELEGCIQNTGVMGDLYAIAIQCSKINLGILSEQVKGSSSGDLITSRTFHIPGSSGFLLHEKNEESVLYFREDEEAGFFTDEQDLVLQVRTYLADDALRARIQQAGYNRALKEHSLDARAIELVAKFKSI
jgi:glycosyltransferase involved in cell wall biosynthesis